MQQSWQLDNPTTEFQEPDESNPQQSCAAPRITYSDDSTPAGQYPMMLLATAFHVASEFDLESGI
jgi:hypothetical protein